MSRLWIVALVLQIGDFAVVWGGAYFVVFGSLTIGGLNAIRFAYWVVALLFYFLLLRAYWKAIEKFSQLQIEENARSTEVERDVEVE